MTLPGKLILIPIPIAEGALHTLPAGVAQHTLVLRHYFAENARTARRFLKSLHPTLVIEDIQFSEMSKHEAPDTQLLKSWLKEGIDVGVVSEAGCPGIADPGALLAGIAHEIGATVVPITGPTSLILALMASGLNGQSFSFTGYLPVKDPERGKRIKALEELSKKENQTQLFIETPYRNNAILDDLLRHCQPHTRLCIAMNLTAPDEFIKTQKIKDWKLNKPTLGKLPAVFLLLG